MQGISEDFCLLINALIRPGVCLENNDWVSLGQKDP